MSRRSPRTRRQRRYEPLAVLSYIARYQRHNRGRSPSQRCIQASLHISAPSVVHGIVHRLERQGLLMITTYGHGMTADLTLTKEGRAAAETWQREQPSKDRLDRT